MNEIRLGCGKVMIGSVLRKDGKVEGLLFRPTNEEHCIDTKDPNWKEGDEYILQDGDTVVWIDSLESARVLLERVAIIALGLNGFQVTDK